jgi:hypothetical protein
MVVKPISEDRVCTCNEETASDGCFSATILVAVGGSEYGETTVLVSCLEEETITVDCCLITGICDNKLDVAAAAELWIILSGATFCREKGFFGASVLHPV